MRVSSSTLLFLLSELILVACEQLPHSCQFPEWIGQAFKIELAGQRLQGDPSTQLLGREIPALRPPGFSDASRVDDQREHLPQGGFVKRLPVERHLGKVVDQVASSYR